MLSDQHGLNCATNEILEFTSITKIILQKDNSLMILLEEVSLQSFINYQQFASFKYKNGSNHFDYST